MTAAWWRHNRHTHIHATRQEETNHLEVFHSRPGYPLIVPWASYLAVPSPWAVGGPLLPICQPALGLNLLNLRKRALPYPNPNPNGNLFITESIYLPIGDLPYAAASTERNTYKARFHVYFSYWFYRLISLHTLVKAASWLWLFVAKVATFFRRLLLPLPTQSNLHPTVGSLRYHTGVMTFWD